MQINFSKIFCKNVETLTFKIKKRITNPKLLEKTSIEFE